MLISKQTKRNYIVILIIIFVTFLFEHILPNGVPFTCGYVIVYGGLVCVWISSLWMRIPDRRKKLIFTLLGLSILLWLLMQFCKFSLSISGSTISRLLWYGSYIPLILIPIFSFDVSHYIGLAENERPYHYHRILYSISAMLVLVVMTNDLHEQIFTFPEGIEKAEEIYSHGLVFWMIVVWVVIFITLTIGTALLRMSRSFNRRWIWLIVIPIIVGGIFGFLSITYVIPASGENSLFHYQEVYSFCIILFWEVCIDTGLIRSNGGQLEMVQNSRSGFALVDEDGEVIYSSKKSIDVDFTKKAPEMLNEYTRLHVGKISGGKFYWTDDISGLIRLQDELSSVREELSMEGDVLRGEKEYQEKLVKVRTRARLYDNISRLLEDKINRVKDLIDRDGDDNDNLQRAGIVGAYIKRRSNLEILAESSDTISVNELRFSIEESMNYIRLRGINCISEMGIPGEEDWSSEDIYGAYELFEKVVEENLDKVLAIRTNISNTLYIYITSTEGEWEEVRYDKSH